MFNILILSHSHNLAVGVKELISQMAPDVNIETSGGTEDKTLGSNFEEVNEKINRLSDDKGVVVIFDAGSSMMNAQMAIEMLDDEKKSKVVLADVPMVEGAIQLAVMAQCDDSFQEAVEYINKNKYNKIS